MTLFVGVFILIVLVIHCERALCMECLPVFEKKKSNRALFIRYSNEYINKPSVTKGSVFSSDGLFNVWVFE